MNDERDKEMNKKFELVLASDDMTLVQSIESLVTSVKSVNILDVKKFENEYPEVTINVHELFVNDLYMWYVGGNVEGFSVEDFMEMEVK